MDITEPLKIITRATAPMFKVIPGGYFALATTVLGIATIGTASALYYPIESFTFFSHWISNLGGAVTNSGESTGLSRWVFSAGLMVIAACTTPFVLALINELMENSGHGRRLVLAFSLAGVATLVGIVGVALFDLKSQPAAHTYAATIYFVGTGLMMFVSSLAMLFNPRFANLQALVGVLAAGVGLVFLLTLVPHLLEGRGLVELVTSDEPGLAVTRFVEWMFLAAFFIWALETGVYMLKTDKSGTRIAP